MSRRQTACLPTHFSLTTLSRLLHTGCPNLDNAHWMSSQGHSSFNVSQREFAHSLLTGYPLKITVHCCSLEVLPHSDSKYQQQTMTRSLGHHVSLHTPHPMSNSVDQRKVNTSAGISVYWWLIVYTMSTNTSTSR